jgi:uncharacterized protein YndB with AHSA1/START domain
VSAKPPETSAVEHTVRIAALPETVFAYFTDPAKIVRWLGTDATLDPSPGGACRIKVNDMFFVLGEYVEVVPYRRIVFSWGYEQNWFAMPPQSTVVEVSLTPDGEDTIVLLSHRRLPGAIAGATTQAGWEHYLPRLAIAASGGHPGPDPWLNLETAAQVWRDLAAGGLFEQPTQL